MQAAHLRHWWRPGLPLLTLDGVLLVPNDSRESKLAYLRKLAAELSRNTFKEDVPETDLELIKQQVHVGLGLLSD